jgi:hypothetical protein
MPNVSIAQGKGIVLSMLQYWKNVCHKGRNTKQTAYHTKNMKTYMYCPPPLQALSVGVTA